MIRRIFKSVSGASRLVRPGAESLFGRAAMVSRRFADNPAGVQQDVEGSDKDFQPKEKKIAGATDEELKEQIDNWVRENKFVLFMKGNPQMPMCGYSKFVVEILKFYNIKDYKSVDVLKDQNLRRVVKEYSDWPTFPQLYVNGELLGGCDIITDMHKQGTLKDAFSKNI